MYVAAVSPSEQDNQPHSEQETQPLSELETQPPSELETQPPPPENELPYQDPDDEITVSSSMDAWVLTILAEELTPPDTQPTSPLPETSAEILHAVADVFVDFLPVQEVAKLRSVSSSWSYFAADCLVAIADAARLDFRIALKFAPLSDAQEKFIAAKMNPRDANDRPCCLVATDEDHGECYKERQDCVLGILGNQHLTRTLLLRLRPNQWLNDELISAYVFLLRKAVHEKVKEVEVEIKTTSEVAVPVYHEVAKEVAEH